MMKMIRVVPNMRRTTNLSLHVHETNFHNSQQPLLHEREHDQKEQQQQQQQRQQCTKLIVRARDSFVDGWIADVYVHGNGREPLSIFSSRDGGYILMRELVDAIVETVVRKWGCNCGGGGGDRDDGQNDVTRKRLAASMTVKPLPIGATCSNTLGSSPCLTFQVVKCEVANDDDCGCLIVHLNTHFQRHANGEDYGSSMWLKDDPVPV